MTRMSVDVTQRLGELDSERTQIDLDIQENREKYDRLAREVATFTQAQLLFLLNNDAVLRDFRRCYKASLYRSDPDILSRVLEKWLRDG